MSQSNNARVKQINQHPEHTADSAAASHQNQAHLTPQESDRQAKEHGRQPDQKVSHKGNPDPKP